MDKLIEVNSNQCCISLRFNNEKRILAESHPMLFHYCQLKDLENILESRAIKLNNLKNIGKNSDYERKNVHTDFWGIVFIACFSTDSNSRVLWEDFADNQHGVCIEFNYKESFFSDAINIDEPAIGFSDSGEEIYKFGFNLSLLRCPKVTCIPNMQTECILDIKLTDVTYEETQQDISCVNKMLNISNVSNSVIPKFSDEYETRTIGVLRSTHTVILKKIDYILLPIKLENIKLHFGRKVKHSDKEKFNNILFQETHFKLKNYE